MNSKRVIPADVSDDEWKVRLVASANSVHRMVQWLRFYALDANDVAFTLEFYSKYNRRLSSIKNRNKSKLTGNAWKEMILDLEDIMAEMDVICDERITDEMLDKIHEHEQKEREMMQ